MPLHGKRSADDAGAVLHDAQAHSLVRARLRGKTDTIILHRQHDSIIVQEQIDHDELWFAMPNGVVDSFVRNAIKMRCDRILVD